MLYCIRCQISLVFVTFSFDGLPHAFSLTLGLSLSLHFTSSLLSLAISHYFGAYLPFSGFQSRQVVTAHMAHVLFSLPSRKLYTCWLMYIYKLLIEHMRAQIANDVQGFMCIGPSVKPGSFIYTPAAVTASQTDTPLCFFGARIMNLTTRKVQGL